MEIKEETKTFFRKKDVTKWISTMPSPARIEVHYFFMPKKECRLTEYDFIELKARFGEKVCQTVFDMYTRKNDGWPVEDENQR